jgi:hypothetical protein
LAQTDSESEAAAAIRPYNQVFLMAFPGPHNDNDNESGQQLLEKSKPKHPKKSITQDIPATENRVGDQNEVKEWPDSVRSSHRVNLKPKKLRADEVASEHELSD